MAAQRARNRHIAWLLLIVPAGLITYVGVAASQPYCNCLPWYEVMVPPGPALAIVLFFAVALTSVGFAGALGLLPRAHLRGAKTSWSLGVSAFVWIPVLLVGCGLLLKPESGAPNPFLSNWIVGILFIGAAVGGFLVSSFAIWLVCYLVDAARHSRATSSAQS